MNRAHRRNQTRSKSNLRKSGLTYLTVAGVIGGTVGLGSPAHAVVSTTCTDLASDLASLQATGGTLTTDFTDPNPVTCDFAEGYVFQLPTAIVGPTDGTLNVRFTGGALIGFDSQANLEVSNINFTQNVGESFEHFIRTWSNQTLVVSNSTFSNSEVSAAIYAEGSLQVTDSSFTNLTSSLYGAAIRTQEYLGGTTVISSSTFESNESSQVGGAVYSNNMTLVYASTFKSNSATSYGGAIYSEGGIGVLVSIEGSTFESNEADNGGAIYSINEGSVLRIDNSTFVGNSASTSAAVSLSEGSLIRNSTFWNNKASVTTSGSIDGGNSDYFGNILANNDASQVLGDGSSTRDLGANLFTDSSFVVDATRPGEGASELVSATELDLGPGTPKLNSTNPDNSGKTKTIEIGPESIARDFYGATSAGIAAPNPGPSPVFNYANSDQRGVERPFGAGYDVGAFEIGETPDPSPSETPENGVIADSESLADTGLETSTNFLGLIGVGLAAILGGSVGLVRRKRKA